MRVSLVTGKYFNRCRVEELAACARDQNLARRLWQQTGRLAGIEW